MLNQIPLNIQILLFIALLWTLPWKCVALWKSARSGSKEWFLALLFINTLGILEIIYIFIISKDNVKSLMKLSKTNFLIICLITITLITGIFIWKRRYFTQIPTLDAILVDLKLKPVPKKDVNMEFFSEIFELIKDKYWDKAMDEETLTGLYKLAIEKITFNSQNLTLSNKKGLEKLINEVTKGKSEEQKKEFIVQLSSMVLQNLQPLGRSQLYGEKQITNIQNEVKNTDPEKNLYADLGLGNTASQQEIDTAYQNKLKELQAQKSTPEITQKIESLQKIYSTVGDSTARKIYDTSGIQSTVTASLINPRIFYMHMTRFSPTTLDDIVREVQKVDSGTELDTLILDLRDNIGGLIDGLTYFLGPFIGYDRHAYQFFVRGDRPDFKTKIGWLPSLVRYTKVIILINSGDQSSTEVFAAVLKKYNVGVLVGTKTAGWGTLESMITLKNQPDPQEKYTVLLVEALTLREDGEPIEGRGVEPNINIASPGWENELYKRFNSREIVNTVKELLKPELTSLEK